MTRRTRQSGGFTVVTAVPTETLTARSALADGNIDPRLVDRRRARMINRHSVDAAGVDRVGTVDRYMGVVA